MQSNIREVLDKKGHIVHSIAATTSVLAAVRSMNEHHIGAVLVTGGDQLGIFTERDVLRRVIEQMRDPGSVPVSEVMSSPLITVEPSMKVLDVMRLMTDRRIRHLPVMDGEKLMGMVSIGDMTKWVTRDLRDEVEQLESYISGPSL